MPIYQLSKPMIGSALGMGDPENPQLDEVALSTIQVRLEQMFREVSDEESLIAVIHALELKKLADWNPTWRKRAKLVKDTPAKFNAKEGIPDAVLLQLNAAPLWLVKQLRGTKQFCLCHSPLLSVNQTTRRDFTLTVWLRVIFMPDGGDDVLSTPA